MPYPVTQRLGEALSGLDASALNDTVAARVGTAFIDTVGVMLAGKSEPAVTLLAQTITAMGGDPNNVGNAALLGATAAHALDFDDVAFGGHVSAVLVPTILAVATRCGASARDVAVAYVAGYEAWSELASRETTMYHARGLHPTGLLGSVAAAASTASLMRLEPEPFARALSIAASQSAGLLANFGSMTKPFHAGRAAQSGVLAAHLAQAGYSASLDTLEAGNGFLAGFSPDGVFDVERPLNLSRQGVMLGINCPSIKRYPVCYAGHRTIDAILDLIGRTKPPADDIAHIEVRLSERHSKTLRYPTPDTVAQAQFSLEFFVGAAFVRGWVGMAELTEEGVGDAGIRGIMAKVRRVLTDELDPDLNGYAAHDSVAFVLMDGTRLESRPIRRPKGHADNPVDAEDVRLKFDDCLASVGRRQADATRLFEAVAGLSALSTAALPDIIGAEFHWSGAA